MHERYALVNPGPYSVLFVVLFFITLYYVIINIFICEYRHENAHGRNVNPLSAVTCGMEKNNLRMFDCRRECRLRMVNPSIKRRCNSTQKRYYRTCVFRGRMASRDDISDMPVGVFRDGAYD